MAFFRWSAAPLSAPEPLRGGREGGKQENQVGTILARSQGVGRWMFFKDVDDELHVLAKNHFEIHLKEKLMFIFVCFFEREGVKKTRLQDVPPDGFWVSFRDFFLAAKSEENSVRLMKTFRWLWVNKKPQRGPQVLGKLFSFGNTFSFSQTRPFCHAVFLTRTQIYTVVMVVKPISL